MAHRSRTRQGEKNNLFHEMEPLSKDAVDSRDRDTYRSIFFDEKTPLKPSTSDYRRPWSPSAPVSRTCDRFPVNTKLKRLQAVVQRKRFRAMDALHPIRALKRESRRYLVCKGRHLRREVLFALGVAGQRKRRSPGRGGSYRRTADSKISC